MNKQLVESRATHIFTLHLKAHDHTKVQFQSSVAQLLDVFQRPS